MDSTAVALRSLIRMVHVKTKTRKRLESVLAVLGRKLGSAITPRDAADAVLEAADQLIGWDAAFVDTYSESSSWLDIIVLYDIIDGRRTELPHALVPVHPGSVVEKALKEGAQIVLRAPETCEVSESAVMLGDKNRPSASLMYAPIRKLGRPVGVLSLQSYKFDAYTKDDLSLVQMLADYCGGALERTFVSSRLDNIQRTLVALGQKLAVVKSPPQVARVILDAAGDLFGWDCGFVNFYHEQLHSLMVIDTLNGEKVEVPPAYEGVPRPGSYTEITLREGPQLILRKPGQDEPETSLLIGDKQRRSASLMYVPINKEGAGSVGVISIQSYKQNAYTPEDLYTLQILGNYCSGALEYAFSEQKRLEAVEHFAKTQKLLVALGQKLTVEKSPRSVARVILDTANDLFGWDSGFVSLYGERLQSILLIDTINGEKVEVPGAYAGEPRVGSYTEKTLREGAQLILRKSDGEEPEMGTPIGDKQRRSMSLMFVPMKTDEEESVGVLSIQSYTPNAYTPNDLDTFQILGNYCSGTLKHAFSEQKRIEAEEHFAILCRATQDIVRDWNIETDTVWWNDNIITTLGYSAGEVSSEFAWWSERIHPDERKAVVAGILHSIASSDEMWSAEYRFQRSDGMYVDIFDRGYILRDKSGKPVRMIGSMIDVSLRRQFEEELKYGAYHDPLTGLPNRVFFREALERALAHSRRRKEYHFAVLFLDLDRFKIVNDSLGHALGDELLVQIARRISSCMRPGDMVSRFGGDEFAVLLDDLRDEGDISIICERVQESISRPVSLAGHEFFVTASIGIALSSGAYETSDIVLRDADAAMYRAKEGGKARFEIFDQAMHQRTVAVLQIESDLRRAVERSEFFVEFQPIVSLQDGAVFGFESLVRWMHPVKGLLSPDDFISIAEDTGLIIPIGEFVLRNACSWLADLLKHSPDSGLSVNVNISARQFTQKDLVGRICAILDESGLAPNRLRLEITESAIISETAATLELFNRLRDCGIWLILDDFGTGYSSLSRLYEFPINGLKVDRSIVRDCVASSQAQAIISAVAALASGLRMDVVAEGIETVEQRDRVKELGCRYGQGYYFSRPMDHESAARTAFSRLG